MNAGSAIDAATIRTALPDRGSAGTTAGADRSVGVIAVVPDRWTDTVMPRHQVLKRLAQHFPVVWVEPATGWRQHLLPSGARFMRGDEWSSPAPDLEVMTPGWRHPQVLRPAWLGNATFASRLAAARRRLLARGARRIVLYIWRDEAAGALDMIEHDMACYHIDDEYSFEERDVPNSPSELRLLERSDLVIVHSAALMAKKGGINPNTVLIPNGVDYASFATPRAALPDLATISSPRVGYAGVIKKQLDLALLLRLAQARPAYSFVLVGPILNVSGKQHLIDGLRALPNVHFLGGKPIEDLPAYVQHFDVCLMCYDVNDYTKYIYPLKLNEYLATGRPTISSPIDAVVRSGAGVVRIARDDAEWLQSIDDGLKPAANEEALAESRREFARRNEWNTLVDRIAEHFRAALSRAGRVSRSEPA